MYHPENCMCDECIKLRVIGRLAREKAEAEAKKVAAESNAYIRRRGGLDRLPNSKLKK